jgi:hypothetical protein
MALESQQVNVQELQRLNEAIVVAMDAIRRVVPQLHQLQQYTMFAQPPQIGLWGQPQPLDPITAAYFHSHLLRTFAPTMGIAPSWQTTPLTQTPFVAQTPFQTPFGLGQFGMTPFTPSPYINLSQRPF